LDTDKFKYTIVSPEQKAGRSYYIKTDSSQFENVEEFKYLGKKLKI